ncbi:MAG: hypothetical protein GY873_39105 [Bosea sp.]|uniref:helix-turn-helix domain-containing protein n=1 Tax=Bosea sp. (in: a-proteobacteria) TaxID=1871050 RepID=UPI002397E876|nr:hypothetical protein [Bosea sp. (in: a-proteobacteria)]MCP4740213.1 hypothetical protein [Bosea sp. (in: a-proteobacteria)]
MFSWQERSLTVAEFCEAHSVSESLVYLMLADGRLKAVKLGRKTVIPPEAHRSFRESLPMFASGRAKASLPAQPAPKRRGRPRKPRPPAPPAEPTANARPPKPARQPSARRQVEG